MTKSGADVTRRIKCLALSKLYTNVFPNWAVGANECPVLFVVKITNLTASGVCFSILFQSPDGQIKFSKSERPGLAGITASGCSAGRAGASGSGWRVGEVPVAKTAGLFLAGFAGWLVGPCLSARGECKLECVCKGGFQSWPGPAGFSQEKGEPQAPGQPHDWDTRQQVQAGPSGALAPKAWGTQGGPRVFLGEKNVVLGYLIPPQSLSWAIYNCVVSINPQLFIDRLLSICIVLSATCDAEEIRMTSKMSRGLGLRTSVQVPAQLFISYVNFSKFFNLFSCFLICKMCTETR